MMWTIPLALELLAAMIGTHHVVVDAFIPTIKHHVALFKRPTKEEVKKYGMRNILQL